MADFEDARTLGNAVDLSNAFNLPADLPGPLPSWEQPAEMLDGFDQFLQMLPNLTAPTTSTNATVLEPEAVAPSTESANTTQRMTAAERRKDKQKNSQKRFRDRQKVWCHNRATGSTSRRALTDHPSTTPEWCRSGPKNWNSSLLQPQQSLKTSRANKRHWRLVTCCLRSLCK